MKLICISFAGRFNIMGMRMTIQMIPRLEQMHIVFTSQVTGCHVTGYTAPYDCYFHRCSTIFAAPLLTG